MHLKKRKTAALLSALLLVHMVAALSIAADQRAEASVLPAGETAAAQTEAACSDTRIYTLKEDYAASAARTGKQAQDNDLVIVLDPGHDSLHAGARANGLEEEALNLRIALYCREALEKYAGVTVYMTRTGEECPFPGSTSNTDNRQRVDFAASVNADAYVAIHLNSATNESAHGINTFYPNANYRPDLGGIGKALAAEIQKQVVALGINDRGIEIRNSGDNTLYPDGSLADYYGVIKRAKEKGMPGLIVEHAFLTNAEDAAFLSQEENLQRLGEADATGIASYFGLTLQADVPSAEPIPPEDYYFGDVDQNHAVTADDALQVLKHVVNLHPIEDTFSLLLADINHDSATDANDALQILKTVVHLIPLETYTPDASEEPAPGNSEEPAPVVSEEPVPVISEEPVPVASEEPVPDISEEPVPVASEEPAPDNSEEPAPISSEEPVTGV